MIEKLNQLRKFIEIDLWRIRLSSLSKRKRFLFGFLRIWIIAFKEFVNDKCAEKASALTFLSMLSLVPILALLFTIANAFGIRELVEDELERYFQGQTEILDKVSPYVDNILGSGDTENGISFSDSIALVNDSTFQTGLNNVTISDSSSNFLIADSTKTSNDSTIVANEESISADDLDEGNGSGLNKSIITISSIGFLLYTVIRLLMNIEAAFNDMWDIKKSRRWERKISDYVTVILLGPLLLVVASSATVFVKDTIQDLMTQWEVLGQLRSGIVFLLKLLPYTILWLLLFGLYIIFPNTRVKFWPALFAGIVAGTLYQLNQQAFISLQFAFARYNAIYGSIAFLPLFLIWLQISWLIVLFGAEICYGAQYMNQWEMNSETLKISYDYRRKLTLLLLYRIVKKFEEGVGPLAISELGSTVNVPRRYVTDICYELERSKLISKVESDEVAYQPGFDIHKMDLFTVLNKLEDEGMGEFDPRKTTVFQSIENALEDINHKWKDTASNKLLKDL